ncbi:MAG: hypothetical protein COB51_10530 [Moraxellaceae bacterium]|nr:MAG: hypothetical protein COB51_10530 [Moraxellaceae bacterium]
MSNRLISGAGIGLRIPHIHDILAGQNDQAIANIPWFEIVVDNFLVEGGFNRTALRAISERYPLIFHGVALSLASLNPLNLDYLKAIKSLKDETGAEWYSEHLSFSSSGSSHFPDLLPLPYTEETIAHVSERIVQVQDIMGERMLIENISSYVSCQFNEMSEGEFIAEIVQRADCHLLLDINNAYVNSVNFGEHLGDYLSRIPASAVKQIHLAGFTDKDDFLLDAHNNPVTDEVWKVYAAFIRDNGPIPSMIEWDSDLPPLDTLLKERAIAERLLESAQQIGHCA